MNTNQEKKSRWKCRVAYDGTDFEGWQSQVSGQTIQDRIEKALRSCFKRDIRIVGAGRTDSGVHARGQVFHFDADWKHGPETLTRALNSRLPASIQILDTTAVAPDFSARFSASGKRYVYRIHRGFAPPFETRFYYSHRSRPLDIEAIRAAADVFLGTHDFTAFAATSDSDDHPVKTVTRSTILARRDRIQYIVEGSGFLYKQVRSMAGGLIQVGLGKLDRPDLARILAARERAVDVPTAAPEGLTLEQVWYR